VPIFVQIARALAGDIRRGRPHPGDFLPGTRALARTLNVHRNTVIAAYGELEAEGWVTTERGRVLTNPASRSIEQARAYTMAVLELLGSKDPINVLRNTVKRQGRKPDWTRVRFFQDSLRRPSYTSPKDVLGCCPMQPAHLLMEETMTATRVPTGWHTVTPRIVVQGAAGLIQFLRRTFNAGGDIRSDRPSEIRIGDSMILISDAGVREAMPTVLYVYVDDVDATYRRALERAQRRLKNRST
jgi:PhnB protein